MSAQVEAMADTYSALVEERGGKVMKREHWGLKTLAYRIKKNRKGHYAFLRSDAPASAIHEMERLMRLHEDVMRVLTIKMDEHKNCHPYKCRNAMNAATVANAASAADLKLRKRT